MEEVLPGPESKILPSPNQDLFRPKTTLPSSSFWKRKLSRNLNPIDDSSSCSETPLLVSLSQKIRVEAWRLEALAVANPDARAQAPAVRQVAPPGDSSTRSRTTRALRRDLVSGSRGLEAARRRRSSKHQARRPPQRRRRSDRFRLESPRQSIRGIIKCTLHG